MTAPSILFCNRVYPPEHGATGLGIARVAKCFVDAGWRVTVLSSAGSAIPGVSVENGVRVIRIHGLVRGRSLPLRLLSTVLTIPGLLLRTLCEPPPDIIVTMTDPPMLPLIGPILRVVKRSRLVHWAHDLYPDVAVRAGVLSGRGVTGRILDGLSRRALGAHDRIIAVGRCMEGVLAGHGIPSSKITFIPNSWAGSGIVPLPREESLLGELRLLDRFTVMYSGNFGRAHDFATILATAKLLQDLRDKTIMFLFSGDGPGSSFLREEVSRMGLANVRFLPRCEEDKLSRNLASGDLHLVTMRPEMAGVVVPSKYYGIVAAARPCLFIGPEDSEITMSLRELGNGLRVAPGDANGFLEALLKIQSESVWSERAATLARHFAESENSGRLFVKLAQDLNSAPPRSAR